MCLPKDEKGQHYWNNKNGDKVPESSLNLSSFFWNEKFRHLIRISLIFLFRIGFHDDLLLLLTTRHKTSENSTAFESYNTNTGIAMETMGLL